MYINDSELSWMLHALMVDLQLDDLPPCPYLESSKIESACAKIEVGKLEEILRKYTSAEEMFTVPYYHGKNENIKVLVDMGKAVDTPGLAHDVLYKIRQREPLFFRCLVEVFMAWIKKTEEISGSNVISETEAMTVEK
jgi:hypothetical protein